MEKSNRIIYYFIGISKFILTTTFIFIFAKFNDWISLFNQNEKLLYSFGTVFVLINLNIILSLFAGVICTVILIYLAIWTCGLCGFMGSNKFKLMCSFVFNLLASIFLENLDVFNIIPCSKFWLKFQLCGYIFNCFGISLTFLYITSRVVFIIGLIITGIIFYIEPVPIENELNKKKKYLKIIYFLYLIPLFVSLIYEIWKYIRNKSISTEFHDIFCPNEGRAISKNLKGIFREGRIASKNCINYNCRSVDPKHRVLSHRRSECFDVAISDDDENFTIGFHQTSIKCASSIIRDEFRPSSEGWLGKGIYFAKSIEATESKANNKGAVICAKIKLGKVKKITRRPTTRSNSDIPNGYDCLYLEHPEREKDEYIIREGAQIYEYSIVLFDKQIIEHRKRFSGNA